MLEMNDPQYKTKDGSALRIWRDTAQNNFLSEKLGRPMYDDVVYCEVISPGSRDSTPIFEVIREYHPDMQMAAPRHGSNYEQFKEYITDFEKNEGSSTNLAGTPILQWSEVNRAMASTLRAANIFTVDALAELPDTKLSVVGPDGRTWREKARAYISAAKDAGYATKLAAELDRTREELRSSNEQILAFASRIEQLERDAGRIKDSNKAQVIDDII